MFEKLKEKLFGKKKTEKLDRETIKRSLMESFDARPKLVDEDGNEYEDNDYVKGLIDNYNSVCDGEQKTSKSKATGGDWLKFFAGIAAALASVFATIMSYKFGKECVDSEKDGNIVPRNKIGYPKLVEKEKVNTK